MWKKYSLKSITVITTKSIMSGVFCKMPVQCWGLTHLRCDNYCQVFPVKNYSSLGFTIAQLEKSNDRGIRLEAMHMRGIEDMEEEDIMQYFNEFEPSTIEWIDDESCKLKNS